MRREVIKKFRLCFPVIFCLLFKNGFSAYSVNYNYWIVVCMGP